jgi:hypothetical protein
MPQSQKEPTTADEPTDNQDADSFEWRLIQAILKAEREAREKLKENGSPVRKMPPSGE